MATAGVSEIQLLDEKDAVIKTNDVSYTTFRDLEVSYSLGHAFRIENGTDNLIAGCEISKCIEDAVQIINGTNHGVQSNDIHHLGAGGILLSGGDRQTLTPANHYAVNNHIYEFGQITRVYAAAVQIPRNTANNNVGMYVAHNEIHGTPHVAVEYCGNNNIFEYNEIYDICRVSNDMGAFYSWHDWSSYGNVVRYNYIHDSPQAHGAYYDDGDSGDSIYYNIMQHIDVGVFLGGGHDNVAFGNLAVNCEKTVHIDNRGVSRGYDLNNIRLVNRVTSVDYQNPPWSIQYPSIVDILSPTYSQTLPVGSEIDCNIALNTTQVVDINATTATDWEVILGTNYTDTDPNLADPATADLAAILAATGYNGENCFDKMADWSSVGLIEDEYRTEELELALSIALEGPYDSNTGLMSTTMNTNTLIPTLEPYSALGMHNGNESTTPQILANHEVVDWILVELRDRNSVTTIVETAVGLLLADGSVVSLDGENPITLTSPADNYYIAVKHRNHLGVMTLNTVNISASTSLDFRTEPLYGGTSASTTINGVQILWAGDPTADGMIDALDRGTTWNSRNQMGYLTTDCNLDGSVDALDRGVTWNNRNNESLVP